ncbi:MAG: 3-oxoacyl-ACP reductase FabG [Oligoflexia bacterium]|nr:3-oxoacyl-ACP reductase FabG [Oligoflexia bacterium]MBF0364473.1 3-oxoacyl-ACP reductase FabG [Oligoflexia bacterium]
MSSAIYNDLQGKSILVTGGMRGIGREIVLSLARQGAHVIFNATKSEKNQEKAGELLRKIEECGGKGTPLLFDVSNFSETQEAIASLLKEGHSIVGLVNNAGVTRDQLILKVKEDDIDKVIDTNLKGTINVTTALARHFLKVSGEGGNVSVVNISSVVGLMGNPAQTIYAASKAGIIGFTKAFAKELASKKVRCNVICPGFIETDMTSALSEKVKESYIENIPLKRAGQSQDVASLVCFLLSHDSSYITGETIKIDGGLYI